jgi:hypothetical protein
MPLHHAVLALLRQPPWVSRPGPAVTLRSSNIPPH